MRKAAAVLVASSLVALGLLSAPATADSWTWRDRSGGRGPLAITSVGTGHWPSGAPRITVTFDRPLKASRMGPKDFVVVDVEGNGKRPSDAWIYIVARRGRLESFEHNPTTGETYSSLGFDRPSPRSVRVVPWNYSGGGFGFAAATYSENAAAGCGGGCWDFAPDGGYLVHDWTPPEVKRFDAPEGHHGFWYQPQIPVSWRAVDTGYSGLVRTSVEWREPDATRWRRLVTRRGRGPQEARVEAVEGAHMLLQAVGEDGAGNVGVSYPELLRVPFDDANEDAPGTFTGAWAREKEPEASRGSVNVGAGPAATLTFTDTADTYCVVVRGLGAAPARARLQVGDGAAQDITNDAGAPAYTYPYCVTTETVAAQTATFVVLAGRMGVDGYWAGDASAAGLDSPREHHRRLTFEPGPRPALRSLRRASVLR